MSSYPCKELGEFAEVFVGVARHGRTLTLDENAPTAQLIGMKALRPEGIDFELIEEVHLAPKAELRDYQVAEQDLLIPCRGTAFRVLLAPPQAAGMLIDSNVLAIRCGPQLVPAVLEAYFKHPAGQMLLERASQSTTRQKNLTVKVVRRLKIPIPPRQAQDQLVALLAAAQRQHEAALEVAQKRLALARQITVNTLFHNSGEADHGQTHADL